MTQTQVQIQTPRKTYTRSEFFEAMNSMIRVHDYRAAVIYLNSVVREVLEANGSSYSVILNPYEPAIENVIGDMALRGGEDPRWEDSERYNSSHFIPHEDRGNLQASLQPGDRRDNHGVRVLPEVLNPALFPHIYIHVFIYI